MASKYYVGSGNWSTAANWRTTSGGGTATTVPTTSDTAYLDANSGDVTVDTTSATAGNLVCTNHAGTFTITASQLLTIVTSITLSSGQTLAGTGRLKMTTGAGTYTSAGLTIPWEWEFSSATGTKTLADNWTLTGCVYQSANCTINGNKIYAQGGWQSTSTSQRIMYGTVEVWLQGGVWYSVYKRTAGKVVIDGSITITGGTGSSNSPGVYDATLEYSSGTPTVSGALFASGTSTVKLGSSCVIDDLDMAGTMTLTDDIYCLGSVQVVGTTSVKLVGSGGNRVIYVGEDLIMYNLGTFINTDGTVKVVMNGTGKLQASKSLSGIAYAPLSSLQIDVDINTAGTITICDANSYNAKFAGNRTLKWVAGTVNFFNAANEIEATGTFTFDINSGFTVQSLQVDASVTATISTPATFTTMDIATGANVYGVNGVVIGTLRIDGSGSYYTPNTGSLNVTTNLYMNGTDSLVPIISANPINLTEFKGGIATVMNSTIESDASNYRRITFPSFTDITTFSFAFDYIHTGYVGYQIISGGGDGYLWTPSNGTGSLYFFMTPSDSYYAYVGISTAKRRVVITKELGSAMKFYVDGVSKSVSVSGSSANLVNADIDFSFFAWKLVGDVLFFSGTAVDTDWVASDYAAFQANGNSSAGLYDATETGLTAGWHVDSWTTALTDMILKFDGSLDTQKLFRGRFRYVDASTSAVPIRSMFGSTTNSINAYANTLKDIGGAGVSVTHY